MPDSPEVTKWMTVHRGFAIEVERAPSLGGWEITTLQATQVSNGYMLVDEFTEGEDPLEVLIDCLKARVDEFLDAPLGDDSWIIPDA